MIPRRCMCIVKIKGPIPDGVVKQIIKGRHRTIYDEKMP